MQVRYPDGKTEDLSTGQARRLIQAGAAVLDEGNPNVDDNRPISPKQPTKPKASGPKADGGADVSGGKPDKPEAT